MAFIPTVSSLTIAGKTIVKPENYIVLGTSFGIGLNGGLLSQDGTIYTPSSGMKFVADLAIYQYRDPSAVTTANGPGSCDNILTINDSSAPVNPVYAFGASTASAILNGVSGRNEANVFLTIPNGKYGFQINNGNATNGASVVIYGHEEPM